MKKRKHGFVKEIFIGLLLLILILLILAVALYDFIPSNINVPEVREYSSDTVTTAIKQEIAYTNGGNLGSDDEEEDVKQVVTSLKSYSIDATDLNVYGQKNLYNSGNSNPFNYGQDDAEVPSDTPNGGNGQSTTNSTTNTSTSGGTFFESSTSK